MKEKTAFFKYQVERIERELDEYNEVWNDYQRSVYEYDEALIIMNDMFEYVLGGGDYYFIINNDNEFTGAIFEVLINKDLIVYVNTETGLVLLRSKNGDTEQEKLDEELFEGLNSYMEEVLEGVLPLR